MESVALDVDDALVFKVEMSEATLYITHTNPRGQGSELILKLVRVVAYEEVGGSREVFASYQMADLTYSAKTYHPVLEDVNGKGLEIEWRMQDDSNLKLNLELFHENAVYDGFE